MPAAALVSVKLRAAVRRMMEKFLPFVERKISYWAAPLTFVQLTTGWPLAALVRVMVGAVRDAMAYWMLWAAQKSLFTLPLMART